MESERSDCRPILAQAALPSGPREFNIIVNYSLNSFENQESRGKAINEFADKPKLYYNGIYSIDLWNERYGIISMVEHYKRKKCPKKQLLRF